MKFTTITYDANLPTVQQINIPTNTDYKVGMKVKRNGSVQSIKPSEYTIYTGEINVIPPTDWNGAAKDVASSSGYMVVLYQSDATAAMNGKKVKAKDIRFEASYDSGETWEEVAPIDFANYLLINDRSAGTNNYVAQLDPRVPTKWYLLSGGEVVGEAAEITMPTTFYVLLSSISQAWGFKSFPCQFRIVIPYGGYEERVTYPVDQEKTNGYVTITKASGDDASFKQYGVHIDKGYDFNDEISDSGQCPATQGDYKCQVKVVAGEVGLAGLPIKPEDIEYTQALNSSSPVDPTTLTWKKYIDNIKNIGLPTTWVISELPDSDEKWSIFWNEAFDNVILADGSKVPLERNKAYFYKFTPTAYTAVAEELVLPAGATFQGRAIKFNANKYWFQGFKVKAGTPFSADFKLNINEFKSQSGDIAETLADGSSVKVDGTYADGTTFSFDFCTK